MLTVSPAVRDVTVTGKDDEIQGMVDNEHVDHDFSEGNLLESIDFHDLFVDINEGDVLPELEIDPGLLAEFSISEGSDRKVGEEGRKEEEPDRVSGGEEIMSKRDELLVVNPVTKDGDKGMKPSTVLRKNNSQGKRKMKVDWTPELHRRFVQAVEQLGVDKAVPSRILEIMGIDCLTRHNIASHLQKYRSHRKHLQAREAEAASWTQKGQMYRAASSGGGGSKRNVSPSFAPTMGFPPMTHWHHHFRPLHVWGHPSMDPNLMHMWPKHLPYSPSLPPPLPQPPSWAPQQLPLPPPDPSFWNHHQRVPNGTTPGTPYFPQPLPFRFATPPVPGLLPHSLYKLDPYVGRPVGQSSAPYHLLDFHPSKECIDATIWDVLSKPWLPLPLGLRPPSINGVLEELQRQGIPKIPPFYA